MALRPIGDPNANMHGQFSLQLDYREKVDPFRSGYLGKLWSKRKQNSITAVPRIERVTFQLQEAQMDGRECADNPHRSIYIHSFIIMIMRSLFDLHEDHLQAPPKMA